jgi:di/tricarboxylate transporter
MGPGGYRSIDFMKSGMVISVLFIVVMILMVQLIYGA